MPTKRRPIAANDPSNRPAYPLAEAARYLKLPVATLRAWTLGRPYPTRGKGHFRPMIRPASRKPPILSFSNLIEAHVLRALRTEHGVSVKAVRQAVDFAERTLDIERLLLRPELCSEAGQVFLDRYGELINLSASGQLAMRQVLRAHLQRVEWDDHRIPARLHPFLMLAGPHPRSRRSRIRARDSRGRLVGREAASPAMPIAIDPRISFGRPVVISRGISTAAIVGRIDAGETVADLAADYDLSVVDIENAVLYERAA